MTETSQLSIVIPNRNRDLSTVRRSLASVHDQLNAFANLTVVDYGSEESYQKELKKLINDFPAVKLILCPTQGQLWNKSRCINMVLNDCQTPFFMVCDMDMIWHPEFLQCEKSNWGKHEAVYYTVGMLTREESMASKNFLDCTVNFKTNSEATGITVFETRALRSINGFDEYYHGWGAEDTDAHNRMRNAGFEVNFEDKTTYFLHQWHQKLYRSKESSLPFHGQLERINHEYSLLSRKLKRIRANEKNGWGIPCLPKDYKALKSPDIRLFIKSYREQVAAICKQLSEISSGKTIEINIAPVPNKERLKSNIKFAFGKKKHMNEIPLEVANQALLEQLVGVSRNYPYKYSHDWSSKVIKLTICLKNSD